MNALVGVDLGKTGGRARALAKGRLGPTVGGAGAPGLAERAGVEAAEAAVRRLIADATRQAGLGVDAQPDLVVIGAAGAEANDAAAEALAQRLADRVDAEVLVTSDAVSAHAGALNGAAGAVLAMGTGAVSLGIGAEGQVCQMDGWGYWLGDDGGGSWIGREALRAVLLARDGRGPATLLRAAAEQRFGDLDRLPTALAGSGAVAAVTASFVPDVAECAAGGDPVASGVLAVAAGHLAATVTAAADAVGVTRISAVGGLTGLDQLMNRWNAALADRLDVVPPHGTALDGAVLLAMRRDLPHESRLRRARPHRARARIWATGAAEPNGLVVRASAQVRGTDVDVLETEQVRADLADLDQRSPEQLVDVLLDAEGTVPRAVTRARVEISEAVTLVEKAFASGGRLVYVGAGTPGRLAALDAAECPPTFGTSPDQVLALLAGGSSAAASAVEGAEDDAAAGARDVRAAGVSSVDVVIGISASGRTPYVLAALETAREAGAPTVAIVNNTDSAVRSVADVVIELLTGPEVLAGSTRLKSGTAQKVVLNTISTAAMVRSGKSYGAWMVDVQASNEKLRRRAQRIVREAAGVDDTRAGEVLEVAGWRTKLALVMTLGGLDVDEARARLSAAGGRVRDAVVVEPPAGTRGGSAGTRGGSR